MGLGAMRVVCQRHVQGDEQPIPDGVVQHRFVPEAQEETPSQVHTLLTPKRPVEVQKGVTEVRGQVNEKRAGFGTKRILVDKKRQKMFHYSIGGHPELECKLEDLRLISLDRIVL